MHTTESKWQDEPLEIAKRLREAADGQPIGLSDFRKGAAVIESLVKALEYKLADIAPLEPSE